MNRCVWLFLCFSFLFIQQSSEAVNSDPRFFGVYCGDDEVCGPTIIGKRCKDINNIITKLTYTESAMGGLVHGSGTAEVDGKEVNFVIAGVVVDHGIFRGSATVAGLGNRASWAYLSSDGTKITIHAEGQEIELSKFKCNNTFPQVTITEFPTIPVSYGQLMFFKGEVTDAQDISFPPERLVWKADNTVLLGKSLTGLSASTNALSPGNHTITFTATDHGGLTSTASVQVTIVNKPPNEPFINSPTVNAAVSAGCNIFFSGGAYDQEDAFITGTNLVWSSNIDGIIGTGAELKNKLTSPGTHVVRLTANDSVGESSFKEHTINVNPSTNGCPPTVKIVSPPSEGKGAVVIFSPQNITFVGSAEDPEDTPDSLQFEWTLKQISPSEPEQNIGTALAVEDILFDAAGTDKRFEITFQATDTSGNSAVDKIEILVLSEPIL